MVMVMVSLLLGLAIRYSCVANYLYPFLHSKRSMIKKKSLILASIYTLWSINSFAAGAFTLNGTYGCISSPNFSGFSNRVASGNGSSSDANGLLLIKFTTGSSTISMSGVSNNINNFEQKNATVKTSIVSNLTHFNYTPNNPVDNMYLIQDTSSSPPFISYFIMVNSGKTLIIIDAPTADKNSNTICQAL